MSGGAGQCHCEAGFQKAVDLVAGGLPRTGKNTVSRRRMGGNYRLVSLT